MTVKLNKTIETLKAKNIELELKKASEISKKKGASILIYGPNGVGKTSLLRSLPPDDTIVVNIDGGISVIGDMDTTVIDVTNDTDIRALKMFYNKVITKEIGPWKYWFIDSISELETYMRNVITDHKGKIFPTIKEYGDASFKLGAYLRMFRDLVHYGSHVVFCAAEKDVDIQNDVDGVKTKAGPYVSKNMVIDVCSMVDVVIHMEKDFKTDMRWFRTDSTDRHIAKKRYPWLDKFEKPNLEELFKKIEDGGSLELPEETYDKRHLNEITKGERPV